MARDMDISMFLGRCRWGQSVLRYTWVACDLRSSVFFSQLRGSGILVAHACRRQAPRHQARVVSRHGTRILTWKCHRRFGVRYRPDFVRQSVFNLWQQAVSIWPANMVACLLHDVRMLNEASAGSLSDDPSLLLLGARHL
jgi:hypothetical protein